MAVKSFTIFPADAPSRWRIGWLEDDGTPIVADVPGCDADELPQIAKAVARALGDRGYDGRELLLALPSAWCLSASVQTTDLPAKGRFGQVERHTALSFRLEEKLPLAAEDVVTDFIEGQGSSALGIAVKAQDVKRVIEALESHGLTIGSVCPAAILAAQDVLSRQPAAQALLLGSNGHTDVLTTTDSVVRSWSLVPTRQEELRRRLELLAQAGAPMDHVVLAGIDPAVGRDLLDGSRWTGVIDPAGVFEAATHTGAAALASGRRLPIDLRRGLLAAADRLGRVRTPLIAAAAAVLVLLVVLNVALVYRGMWYEQSAELHLAEARELFTKALPGQQAPAILPAIRTRLESEHRKAAGLRGTDTPLPRQLSALTVLYNVLINLPAELRLRILELRVDGHRLEITGEARSHSDADTIASALRTAAGLKVDPPRTQRLREGEEGVSFVLSAQLTAIEEAKP